MSCIDPTWMSVEDFRDQGSGLSFGVPGGTKRTPLRAVDSVRLAEHQLIYMIN